MRLVPVSILPLTLLALALLLPAPAAPSGLVIDEHGPVRGAVVRLDGSAVSTRTDASGRFRLPPSSRRFTAWKEGYFIAGSRSPFLRLEPLPSHDNEEYAWVDPRPDASDQACGNCHAQIHDEWSRGGHARSATGRAFRDLYADLLAEHPNGSGVCASCHAPGVREDDPALFDLRRVKGVDALGVHCDYCHKVAGPSEDREAKLGLTHGRFFLRLLRPSQGQLFFGPLDDVDRGEDSYSPFYRDSRYCAACHEGTIFSVAVYTTYSEWRQSPAGRQGRHCQHCHTRPSGKLHNVAPDHGGRDRDPMTLGNHHFFDESQEAMLRRSLSLKVTTQRSGERITATVTLTARGVGHKVPTGFIERQLLLVVEASDRDGQAVPLLDGPRLPAVAGRDLVDRPGRVYARLLRDEAGSAPVPFWRSLPEPEDTRLSPEVPDVRRFAFAAAAERLRVRVLHRRFWAATSEAKGWANRDLVVIDRMTLE